MADLRLADAVDAAEALLEAVGVPGQVVVHHEMGALEVDPLAGRVGSEQQLRLRVVQERLLRLAAFFTTHAAVNQDDSLRAAEERADAPLEVVEGVPVLGEENQLLARRGNVRRNGAAAVRPLGFGDPATHARRREDLAQQAGELLPLGIVAALKDLRGKRFEALERGDLGLELGDGARRGGLVEHSGFGGLDLVVRGFVDVLDVLSVEHRPGIRERQRLRRAPLQKRELAHADLETVAPPPQ